MKRSMIVAAGTAVGVTAVVSYHATTTTSASSLTGSAATASTSSAQTRTGTQSTSQTTTTTTSSTPTRTTSASTTRSAVGQAVDFQYGRVQVKVTERAGKITNVAIASFQVDDPHSQSIDEFAVPQLAREVIAAQSARIDGVSGASYTSQAYEQSVQSALDKL